jgi:hypothetical protein
MLLTHCMRIASSCTDHVLVTGQSSTRDYSVSDLDPIDRLGLRLSPVISLNNFVVTSNCLKLIKPMLFCLTSSPHALSLSLHLLFWSWPVLFVFVYCKVQGRTSYTVDACTPVPATRSCTSLRLSLNGSIYPPPTEFRVVRTRLGGNIDFF